MKSTVLISRELQNFYNVLYIEHPPTIYSLARDYISGWTNRKLPKFSYNSRTRSEAGVRVLTPPCVLPINFLPNSLYDIGISINMSIVRKSICEEMNKQGMSKPIIISALNPHYGYSFKKYFSNYKHIYYCYDNVSARKWNSRHGDRYEDLYVEEVECVVVSSKGLLDKFRKKHQNIYLVRNGVDYELFSQTVNYRGKHTLPKPCIGYIGSLDERVDYELLHRLARENQHWRLLLVGRQVTDRLKKVSKLSNVECTGPIEASQLPRVMGQMDIGIIPFVSNSFTENIYPLKANEYLAAGMPVVSTSFTDLSDFENFIDTAKSYEDFVSALRSNMSISREERSRRMNFAKRRSWKEKAKKIKSIIESLD